MGQLLPRGAALDDLMGALVTAEQAINDVLPAGYDPLQILTWRPSKIDPPSLYHMIGGAPFEQLDTAHWRDTLRLLTRIAVAHRNYDDTMDELAVYTDAFRLVMDPVLGARGNVVLPDNSNPPVGAAKWSERTDMRSSLDTFNDIDYLCMEFVLQFRLERVIEPT